MLLHHIALYTKDLERLKEFYVRYFQAVPNEKYRNPKTGLETYFLTFGGDCKLELMQHPESEETERPLYRCGLIHMAVGLDSREAVEELTERMTREGCQLVSGCRITGDGYFESCVKDPDGNLIELVWKPEE